MKMKMQYYNRISTCCEFIFVDCNEALNFMNVTKIRNIKYIPAASEQNEWMKNQKENYTFIDFSFQRKGLKLINFRQIYYTDPIRFFVQKTLKN